MANAVLDFDDRCGNPHPFEPAIDVGTCLAFFGARPGTHRGIVAEVRKRHSGGSPDFQFADDSHKALVALDRPKRVYAS